MLYKDFAATGKLFLRTCYAHSGTTRRQKASRKVLASMLVSLHSLDIPVYDERAFDDKIDRALKKLDEIKPHITKWWTARGEPIQLSARSMLGCC
ncbi:hypothetical protein ABH999_000739 [Bradyrhizobium yuanmingense]|uniref:hypothetical protein n=1 Tax=Bradyrhizobium yuanmingense TaxID=108015 RepID=UPI003516B845